MTRSRIRIIGLISFLIILISLIYYIGYALPFNQVKCGNQNYVLYRDIENPYYMYNINNSKMFWKWSVLAKSIQYSEVENGITTILHIHENGTKIPFKVESTGTINPQYYNDFIENHISFIPTNNVLTQQDIQNLKVCYPNALLQLESNITRKNNVIEGQFYIIK